MAHIYEFLSIDETISMRSLVLDAVHCEWNDWVIGDCSVTCGEGIRTNTRTQKEAAQFGGDGCEGLTSSTESCYDQDCPGIEHIFSSSLTNLMFLLSA